jgi:ribosomal 50S subunit-recycling heat shock protein
MSQQKTGGRRFWIWGTLGALSLAVGIAGARAEAPKVGDKVEIKFGDSWVEATITWIEGDRVRARSAQGLESWFNPGEFRAASKTETKPGDKPPAAGETPAAPEKTAGPLKTGDDVQVSFAGTWLPAKILKVEGQRVQAKLQSGMEKWFNQGEYKPPAGAKPLPGAKPPALPHAGDTVEVSFAGTWLEAKVLKLEGQRVQAKLKSGMEKWFDAGDYRTLAKIEPKFYAGLVAGSKVQAFDGSRWLPATIKRREAARFFIHYDDWSDAWDTWLNPDKIKPRAEAMGQFATGGVAAGAGETAAPEGVIQTAAGSVVLGDMSTATELSAEHAEGWALKPEAAPAAPAIGAGPFALGTKFNSGEKVQRIQFLGTDALIALVHDDPFGGAPATRVARVSMAAGHTPEVLTLPAGKRVVDFSPDGTNALCRQTVSEVANCIEIFPLSPGKPGREIVFKPHASKDHEGDMLMAAYVDASHVLSCDSEGELVLYELPSEKGATTPPAAVAPKPGATTAPAAATPPRPKAIYRMKVNPTVRPVLMPSRKVIVAAANEKLRFFDALTGAPLGAVGDINVIGATLAFNPAGSLLAVTTPQRMSIIELASGRIAREIPLPPDFVKKSSTATTWLPSGHLLLGKRYLVSPSQRLVIWSYLFPRGTNIESYAGSAWFVAGEGAGPLSLSTLKIPHDQAKTATPPVKVEDLLVFRKGDQVTIDMSTDAPADVRDKIQQSLDKQVKAMGLTPGGGNVRIVASTTSGETKNMEYRVFGRGVQSVSVTEKIHTMAVVLDGKEVWKVTNKAGASFMVTAKQGQSLEDAIREQQDHTYSWLASVKIPSDMVRPEGYKVQGVSRVSSAGAIEPATVSDEESTTTPVDNEAARPVRGAPRTKPRP